VSGVELLPLTGHHAATEHAVRVVAPPYDSLTADEREAVARATPDSFLGALPPGDASGADLDAQLAGCLAVLRRLHAGHLLTPLARPSLALVTLTPPGRRPTTAVIGDAEVAAYTDGRVLGHERIQPDRVAQLARYLQVVRIASSPVCVAHAPSDPVTAATAPALARPAVVSFVASDEVQVQLRLIDDAAEVATIRDAIAATGRLYIADGHHRAAAVARLAAETSLAPGDRAARVLTAVVPTDHLDVLPFHRRIDALELEPGALVARLTARGIDAVALDTPAPPTEPGTFAVTDGRAWWRLDLRTRRRPGAVESLDVRLAEREVIAPLLGLDPDTWPAHPDRVMAIPPTAPLERLAQPGTVGIALPAPSIAAMLAVADAGAEMPAKTTYVTPKLRSGLLIAPR
jgi:uncharacterized protein (DUF1015 family)